MIGKGVNINKQSDIDVLLCCHSNNNNYDQMLLESLRSLEYQTYKDFRVVLVLDDCHDATRSLLNSFDFDLDLDIYEKFPKEGLAKAKNTGLLRCGGELIFMQDADDISLPCRIEVQKKFMDTRSDIDALFSLCWDIYPDGKETPSCFPVGRIETHEDIKWALQYENVLAHPTACIRASALSKIGGYVEDQRYLGREDWATFLLMLQNGIKFWQLQERLVKHRLGSSVPR